MPFPPQLPQEFVYFHPDHQAAPFITFHSWNEYHCDEGLLQMPIAKPYQRGRAGARIVRVHAPVGHRIYHFIVQRLGKKPPLPEPVPVHTGEVLAAWSIVPKAPELQENGRVRLYTVTGAYAFLETLAPQDLGGYRMGGTPYDRQGAGQNVIRPADFVDHLQ